MSRRRRPSSAFTRCLTRWVEAKTLRAGGLQASLHAVPLSSDGLTVAEADVREGAWEFKGKNRPEEALKRRATGARQPLVHAAEAFASCGSMPMCSGADGLHARSLHRSRRSCGLAVRCAGGSSPHATLAFVNADAYVSIHGSAPAHWSVLRTQVLVQELGTAQ